MGFWLAMLLWAAGPCGIGDGARRAVVDGAGEIWLETVSGAEWRVALVNRGAVTISLDVVWTEIGLPVRVRVWGQKPWGVVHGGFAEKLAPGACALFRVKR
ncbi:MAG TPA: hypothetical protein VGK29_11715 [Paludibaculum sp.]|jgi:hypothetical protein